METTRITLISETGYTNQLTSPKSSILLWESVNINAAITRLKLLSQIKNQPTLIDREFSNIRASITWLAKRQEDNAAELLLKYVETLESYLHLRGRDFELASWCLSGLDACEKLRRNPSQILFILGSTQYTLGKWEQADTSWQAAIESSKGIDPIVHAHTTSALGRLQINQGRYKTALNTLAHAESLLNEIKDTDGIIAVRSEIAAYYLNRRELQKALEIYLKIDDLSKEYGAKQSSNHIILMLGVIYRQKKDFDKAIYYLSELCHRGEAQNDRQSLATGTHHLAWVYFELRDLEKARHLCGKALALYEDLKDPRGTSDGYEQLGAFLLEEEKIEDAINLLKQSIQVRQKIGNNPGSISSMRRLALAYMFKGNRLLAFQLAIQVLTQYMKLGIFSRQRILSLSQDFLVGTSKLFLRKIKKTGYPGKYTPDQSAKSIAESFSRILTQSKNKDIQQ